MAPMTMLTERRGVAATLANLALVALAAAGCWMALLAGGESKPPSAGQQPAKSAPGPADNDTLDPFTQNLFLDGQLKFWPVPSQDKDKAPKVFMKTPRYWKFNDGARNLEGDNPGFPLDKEVKLNGDCSIRLDGTGGKVSIARYGYADTRNLMFHSWAYRASVQLKLKDVKGKVWVQADYDWDRTRSQELSGTLDWTEVPVEFQLARGQNLLSALTVYFEGTGTVWIADLQLRMKNPEAFRWWESWNGHPASARLSESAGRDEKAGVLKPPPSLGELDQYGGTTALKAQATGFFRCEKINGKWWLITPDGNAFFKVAMFAPEFTAYSMSGFRAEQNFNTVVDKLIGGRNAWAAQTYDRMKSWGFNTLEWGGGLMTFILGTYGPPPKELAGKHIAYTANTRFELATEEARNGGIKVPAVDWGWKSFPDVFTEEFQKAVESYGTPGQKGSHFNPAPNDPWLIGYLLADEPPWYGPEVWYGSLTDGFHRLPDSAPGKKRWLAFMREEHGDVAKLNASWETNYASWDDFASAKTLPRGRSPVDDRRAFMGLVADRWYSLIAAQIRRYDNKHLVLGGNATRLYPEVYAAEARVVDVLCASLYNLSGLYRPNPAFRYFINDQVYAWTNKPIMIGYMSGALDGGGLPGVNCVETAQQRGQGYLSYLRQAAANEACVGVFWWTYSSWTQPSSEGYAKNWGIVDNENRAYLDTLPYVQQANGNVYNYRLAKSPPQTEAPTLWAPSHHWLLLSDQVAFQLVPLPYPVDSYEIELASAGDNGKTQTFVARLERDYVVATQKLAPGAYRWRARATAKGTPSAWSLPFTFEVAGAEEAAAFKAANAALVNGENWKVKLVQNDQENAAVQCKPNQQGGGAAPLSIQVEKGKHVRRVELSCALPKPLRLKKDVQYSFRAVMYTDTEAASMPLISIGLEHGYEVCESYAPIDRGWLVQRELSGGKPTYLRTTFRPPKDMAAETLALKLENCFSTVQVTALELLPETEYEAGVTLMDDYSAIVRDYQAGAR